MVFDKDARVVAMAQKEHQQIFPAPGWVEHNAEEILRCTHEVIASALQQRGLQPSDLAAIGITNQRETTVVW
jgi:glycerol kinase